MHEIIFILYKIWIVVSIGAIIGGMIGVFRKHIAFIAVSILGVISLFGSIYLCKRDVDEYKNPTNTYKRLKGDISKAEEELLKANKELQKFYIDYPEFKEAKQ